MGTHPSPRENFQFKLLGKLKLAEALLCRQIALFNLPCTLDPSRIVKYSGIKQFDSI